MIHDFVGAMLHDAFYSPPPSDLLTMWHVKPFVVPAYVLQDQPYLKFTMAML